MAVSAWMAEEVVMARKQGSLGDVLDTVMRSPGYRPRRRSHAAEGRADVPMPRAEFVGYEDQYRHGFDPEGTFDAMLAPVWLGRSHSSVHGVLPIGLIGRIVAERGSNLEVWIWNRGIFQLAADGLRRG